MNGSIERWQEQKYDIFGNCIRDIGYDAYGGIRYWVEYEYIWVGRPNTTADETNEPEPVLLVRSVRYEPDGAYELAYESLYDAAGNPIKETGYWNGNPGHQREWTYDASGNEISEIYYNEDGSINYSYEYEYDEFGNQISWSNGVYRSEWEYDTAGNRILENHYSGSSRDSQRSYEYDSGGNLIKVTGYNTLGNIFAWWEYEYDASGNCIRHIWYASETEIDGSWEHKCKKGVEKIFDYESGTRITVV